MSEQPSKELKQQIELWLEWDQNASTKKEIQDLVDSQNWPKLEHLMLSRLVFGTAGLRGPMCAGFNAMNDLVVIQATQGLCHYILEKFPNELDRQRGVIVGYDGRYHSQRFAELTANVFVQAGIVARLYRVMVPTPLVAFGVIHHKCLAGVMVTASHNPKNDNGYKVYWSNGAQIISPHDKNIQKAIINNLKPWEHSWDTEQLYASPLLADPHAAIDAYYVKLLKTLPENLLELNSKSDARFVYTAMHGVGYKYVENGFKVAKLPRVIAVEEQRDPDPEFPTVVFPNPEEGKSALNLSIQKADGKGISIILANDPDADRLEIAEKNAQTGEWKVYNGNEIGALLGWWAMFLYREKHPSADMSNCYMLASTVSSKILRAMAEKEGFHFIETLTGFKWMGNVATDLMAQGKTVLFAFEEAIGFMFSTNVLDKDGVSAACQLATMACYLRATKQMTLYEKLHEIYTTYGMHCNNSSYFFCYDPKTIKEIFSRLRNFSGPGTYPKSVRNGEFPVKYVRDLTTGIDTSRPDGKPTLPVSASSEMITFTFENELIITLRTSGTEPKIKYYAEMCAKPGQTDAEQLLKIMVDAIVEEFLQPAKNNLKAKSD